MLPPLDLLLRRDPLLRSPREQHRLALLPVEPLLRALPRLSALLCLSPRFSFSALV